MLSWNKRIQAEGRTQSMVHAAALLSGRKLFGALSPQGSNLTDLGVLHLTKFIPLLIPSTIYLCLVFGLYQM